MRLSQARLEGVQLAAACVTNVRHDHLDFHNTLANYREAKASIFKHLAGDGFAVLNTDDPVRGRPRRARHRRGADRRHARHGRKSPPRWSNGRLASRLSCFRLAAKRCRCERG